MKPKLLSFVLGAGLLAAATTGHAAVEYVRICSIYGAQFFYIPGTDTCLNAATGDARQQTENGTWRSILPYPSGDWQTKPKDACGRGRLLTIGNFRSTDFTPNAWGKKQTQPVNLDLRTNEFVSRVIMSGGFYDPRVPNRHGVNGDQGLCLKSIDPTLLETDHAGTFNPAFGNAGLPVGCIANSRIVGMPAAYSIAATSAHPSIDSFFPQAEQNVVSGPYRYGRQVVVTTDLFWRDSSPTGALTYRDVDANVDRPLAGTLSVWVCADRND